MQKSIISLFVGVVSIAAIQTASAQVIADWTFQTAASTNSIIGAGKTPGATQSGVLADIGTGTASASHASASTAWSIPAGNGSTNSWSANNWAVNDYWQFSVSTIGVSGLSVSYDQAGSGTGPGSFTFSYSTDDVNFTQVGSANTILLSSWTPATNNVAFTFSYDLSSVTALNNASSVYFRITDASTTSINNGTVASGGTDRVDNFIVNVPEPSSIALAAVGGVACLLAFRRRN